MSTRAGLRQRARALSDDEFARIVWLPLLTAFEGERVRAELVVTLAQPGDTICRLGRPVTYWFGLLEGLLKMSNDDSQAPMTTRCSPRRRPRWCRPAASSLAKAAMPCQSMACQMP